MLTIQENIHPSREQVRELGAWSKHAQALKIAELISTMPLDPAVRVAPRATVVGSFPLFGEKAADLDFEVRGFTPEFLAKNVLANLNKPLHLSNGQTITLVAGYASHGGPDGIIRPEQGHAGNAHVVVFAKLDTGTNVTFSVPHKVSVATSRYDLKSVEINPLMSFEEASKRRSFVHEAAGFDPIDGLLIDPHRATGSLKMKELRILNRECFPLDPLNLYRALAQIGKHEMIPDFASLDLLKVMAKTPLEFDQAKLQPERLRYERAQMLITAKPAMALDYACCLGVAYRDFPQIDHPPADLMVDLNSASILANFQPSWYPQQRIAFVLSRLLNYYVHSTDPEFVTDRTFQFLSPWMYTDAKDAAWMSSHTIAEARRIVRPSR